MKRVLQFLYEHHYQGFFEANTTYAIEFSVVFDLYWVAAFEPHPSHSEVAILSVLQHRFLRAGGRWILI